MNVAGDAEAIFLGHMEKMYGVDGNGMRGGYNGSVDCPRLKRAWVTVAMESVRP